MNLLAWFDPDQEKAAALYESFRFRLMTFFASRGCLVPDELADTVFDRIATKSGIDTIETKAGFVFGVAKKILLEYYRKRGNEVELDQSSTQAPSEDYNAVELKLKLQHCLAGLKEQDRELVLEYMTGQSREFWQRRKALTETFNMSPEAIRMKIVRIKKKLRACLDKYLA